MATNTFERKIEISDLESMKRLNDLINADMPERPISKHPFSTVERDRSERLLKQFLSRSRS